MLRKILHSLLRHRHFWRHVDFDELSEIYVSMMFRSLSISLTNIFVPLYMLRLGYEFVDVLILVTWYFVFRTVLFDLLSGWLISKIGPKHTILCSYLMLTLSTTLFLTLPGAQWPLWLVGGIWGGSSSLFAIPFHVDFSKVQHKDHGGKELGYVHIIEKFGGIIGPLVGGIVATVFGGQYIFLVAIFMLLAGGLPLLRTGEPVALGQSLNFRLLDWKRMKRDLFSFAAYGIELTIHGTMWPLYLGLFVLVTGTAYAELGSLASVSVIAAMAVAFAIGRLIDAHRSRPLLRFGATANAALHLFRPFVVAYPAALLVNTLKEGLTAAYHMPYIKGMYDAGDDLPGRRVAYFTLMELVSSAAKALAWLSLTFLASIYADYTVITIGFVLGGISSLLIMLEKFKALGRI